MDVYGCLFPNMVSVGVYLSDQISSRPHATDFPQMVVNRKGNGTPAISGKSRLVTHYNLARSLKQMGAVLSKEKIGKLMEMITR